MRDFTISSPWYKIKHKEKKYPWPCVGDPDRTIILYEDDVLTRDKKDGTYMKHTGLGCFGIEVPDEDIIEQQKDANLRML